MSHFTVLVIGDNPEKQLEPYNEQDTSEEYMEFVDTEDEYLQEYENETRREYYCASHSSWGMKITEKLYNTLKNARFDSEHVYHVEKKDPLSYFSNNEKYQGYYSEGYHKGKVQWFEVTEVIKTEHPDSDTCFRGTIRVKKIRKPKNIPFKELYADFDAYCTDWHGSTRDSETGRYGHRSNPNAKWDWYQLGGRWWGYFKLKHPNIETAKLGEKSWGSDKPLFDADQAYKKDIDFKGMEKYQAEKAAENYDMVAKAMGGEIPKIEKSWEELTKGPKCDHGKAREEYHNQPALKKVKEVSEKQLEIDPKNHFWHWIDLSKYQCSRDEYIELAKNSAPVTFAVVMNGKWYEKGNMGWWACVSNEKDPKQWINQFNTLINDQTDDTLLSLYDCHI